MARKKTTVYIEEDLLKAAKIAATRGGKKEYQVFEDALRRYLGIVEKPGSRGKTSEDAAMRGTSRELDAVRRNAARKMNPQDRR